MRLKPGRITVISQRITQQLLATNRVEVKATPALIEAAIRKVITNDLAREDALDKEAVELLRQKGGNIDPQKMDYALLVTKTKTELARRKGLVL